MLDRSARSPSVIRRIVLFFAALELLGGCSREQQEPFQKLSRAEAEASQIGGYVWLHHKAGTPLPGTRYEVGFDTGAQFGLGLCRAKQDGGVHPGKIHGQRCNTVSQGKEVIYDEFDALVAPPKTIWHIEPEGTPDLAQALIAGTDAAGKPVYACVARYVTGWAFFAKHHGYQPGEYVDGKCRFAWTGGSVDEGVFFILGATKARSARADAAAPGATGAATPAPHCLASEQTCDCGKHVGCAVAGSCVCAGAAPPAPSSKD